MKAPQNAKMIGRHIVADPKICHGKPTFRGTRVLVADVLDQVSAGMAWETIIDEWNGNVSKEAIREALQLASQALLLRHAACNTQAKRLGSVIRVASTGLSIWRLRATKEVFLNWT